MIVMGIAKLTACYGTREMGPEAAKSFLGRQLLECPSPPLCLGTPLVVMTR